MGAAQDRVMANAVLTKLGGLEVYFIADDYRLGWVQQNPSRLENWILTYGEIATDGSLPVIETASDEPWARAPILPGKRVVGLQGHYQAEYGCPGTC